MKRLLLILCLPLLCSAASGPKSTQDQPLPKYLEDYNAALAAQEKADYQKAIGYYEQSIDKKSDFAEAWNNLGYCYRMIGKTYLSKAGEAYTKAIQYAPKFQQAIEYQGEYFLMTGQIAKAYLNYKTLDKLKSPLAVDLKERLDDNLKQAHEIFQ